MQSNGASLPIQFRKPAVTPSFNSVSHPFNGIHFAGSAQLPKSIGTLSQDSVLFSANTKQAAEPLPVRAAAAADEPALRDLVEKALLHEQEVNGSPVNIEVMREVGLKRIRLVLSEPNCAAVVCTDSQDKPVGMAFVTPRSLSGEKNASLAMLNHLYVEPKRRNSGNASRLLDAAIEKAKLYGYKQMEVYTHTPKVKAALVNRGFLLDKDSAEFTALKTMLKGRMGVTDKYMENVVRLYKNLTPKAQ